MSINHVFVFVGIVHISFVQVCVRFADKLAWKPRREKHIRIWPQGAFRDDHLRSRMHINASPPTRANAKLYFTTRRGKEAIDRYYSRNLQIKIDNYFSMELPIAAAITREINRPLGFFNAIVRYQLLPYFQKLYIYFHT